MSTAKKRLVDKVARIVDESDDDQESIDNRVNDEVDMNELLTVMKLKINDKLRVYIVGCLMRCEQRKKDMAALKEAVKKEELVPVHVHGGGKCTMTLFMTKEAAERERGKR